MKTPNNAPDIKVGHKTPDEIKKGLEYAKTNCLYVDCCERTCPYNKYCDVSEPDMMTEIPREIVADALAYIQQLETENHQLLTKVEQLTAKCHQLERERDTAVSDLRNARNCCRFCNYDDGKYCKSTPKPSDNSCFEMARREGGITVIKALSLSDTLHILAESESNRAKEIHGATYASHNEAFGVLAEEVQEADDDLGDVKRYMEHLLRYVRCDDVSGMRDALNAIQRTAVNAAAEAIQVAAVCEKWMDGMQHDGS